MMWCTSLLLSLVLVSANARETHVVKTQYGDLEGQTFQLHTGKNVSRWHGVPFAKPITPESRFKRPEPPLSWEGVRKAHRLPPACPQDPPFTLWITHPLWSNFSEDCLYVNIYAPQDTSKGPYPVMFYIHGGGYFLSANVQYPGHILAGHDVVVVTTNYRLGALGFMSTADSALPGNMGLWDQVAALQYVHDNIRAFGGDPDKVTIFGQSAGAASVSLLMHVPQAQGLFHQVIAQSGTDLGAWATNSMGQDPKGYAKQVADSLGCPTEESEALVECMRGINAQKVVQKTFNCQAGYFCLGFAPVVDGILLPDEPIALRRRGEFQKVKLMTGLLKDDGSFFTVQLVPESFKHGFNRSRYLEVLETELMSDFFPRAPEYTDVIMKAVDFYYSDWPALDDPDRNRESLNKLITDFAFGAGLDIQAKCQSKYADVYVYEWAFRSPKVERILPKWMGVPHGLELPHVFGYPWLHDNPDVRYDIGFPLDLKWGTEDLEWATYINTLWTNFAKYGDPTPEPVKSPGKNPDTNWPKYNTNTYRHLFMDKTPAYRQEYRQRDFAFWHNYLPYVTDYKLFPAGEPLILPEDAEGGWKTWMLVNATRAGMPNTSSPGGKGYNTGILHRNIGQFFTTIFSELLKHYLENKL